MSDGSVNVTGVNPGDNAMYECDEGFTLVGGGIRICRADTANERAKWSGEDPMCFNELSISRVSHIHGISMT